MSKVFSVGEIVEDKRHLGGDERLQKVFDLPSNTFEPPAEPAPIKDTVDDGDREFVKRLRAAFTPTQAQYYPHIRDVVFRYPSWRTAVAESERGWHAATRGKVEMPKWLTDNIPPYRAQGRTFILAVAYIEKALTHPGAHIPLEDHAGHIGDDFLDNMVKDLIESDDDVRARTSFGRRGELVIVSQKQLESLIAR
jgi:hypothetical protein